MDILNNLYTQVSINAYLQVDDYGFWEGCKKAIDEWFLKYPNTLTKIDSSGVSFFKAS
jgi:hypothetical protein